MLKYYKIYHLWSVHSILPIFLFFALSRTVIDNVVVTVRKYNEHEKIRTEQRRRILETVLWFAFALLLALVVPDIGSAIALIGGLAALFIFFFPGMIRNLLSIILYSLFSFLYKLTYFSIYLFFYLWLFT